MIYRVYFFAAISVILQQLVSILFARNLTVIDFGYYTLFNSYILFLLPVLTFGIQRVIRIQFANDKRIGDSLINIAVKKVAVLCSILAIIFPLIIYFLTNNLLGSLITFSSAVAMGLWSVYSVYFEFKYQWIIRHRLLSFYTFLILIFSFIFLKLDFSFLSRLMAVIVTSIILIIYTKNKIPSNIKIKNNISFKTIRSIGIPLAIVSILENLIFLLDKNIILNSLGEENLGIYSSHLIIYGLVVLSFSPISVIIENLIFQKQKVKNWYYYFFCFYLFFGAVIFCLGTEIFDFLFSSKYNFKQVILNYLFCLGVFSVLRNILKIYMSKSDSLYFSVITNAIIIFVLFLFDFHSVFQFVKVLFILFLIGLILEFSYVISKRNNTLL